MSEWASIFVGLATLFATIILGIIGLGVTRAALFPIDKITALERELKEQKSNLFGMRLLAKAVLQSSRDSHRFNDVTRRLLGTILENPETLNDRARLKHMADLYEKRAKDGLRLMPQQYLALELVTCDKIDFDDALNTFCEMGKDEDDSGVLEFSIEFLESLSGLFDEDHAVKLEGAIMDMKRSRNRRSNPVSATWARSGR